MTLPGRSPSSPTIDVRTLPINRLVPLRRHHRAALPLLAPSFSRLRVSADVVICSSSGWAHGTQVEGKKIVYCHTPARWLYQPDRYLRGRGRAMQAAAGVLRSPLKRWDKQAARSADVYLANSTIVAERIKSIYGIDAEIVPPPPALTPHGPAEAMDGVQPGYFLCVSRLLPYKNVDAVVDAFTDLPGERLVVVGSGPEEQRLRLRASEAVTFVGDVTDAQLRWLYTNCRALIAASHEDFGLTPLEAAGFGKPTAALRWGGFLDTIEEGHTGVYFDEPTALAVTGAVEHLLIPEWREEAIQHVAKLFSEEHFIERIIEVTSER